MTRTVTIRLTDDEWLWLRCAAEQARTTTAKWLRNRALLRAAREMREGAPDNLPNEPTGRPPFVSAMIECELRGTP